VLKLATSIFVRASHNAGGGGRSKKAAKLKNYFKDHWTTDEAERCAVHYRSCARFRRSDIVYVSQLGGRRY